MRIHLIDDDRHWELRGELTTPPTPAAIDNLVRTLIETWRRGPDPAYRVRAEAQAHVGPAA